MGARVVGAPSEAVLSLLRDAEGWGAWLPGLSELELDGDEIRLLLDGPRPLALRLSMSEIPDGLALQLIEGDLSAVEARIRVGTVPDGTEVEVRLRVEFPVDLPASLTRELREQLPARWLDGLERALAAQG